MEAPTPPSGGQWKEDPATGLLVPVGSEPEPAADTEHEDTEEE